MPQILDPRGQRFQREEPFICPYFSNLIIIDTISQFLKILTHNNLSLQSFFKFKQTLFHYCYQSVITDQLLD